MKRNWQTLLVICLCTIIILAGCSSSKNSSGTSTLKLYLTDAPAAANFKAVNVTISEVRISRSNEANTSDWITLSTTPKTVNLMELTNGVLTELGVRDLPVGQYDQIRFIVSEANAVIIDDQDPESESTKSLTVHSGTVKLVNPFQIRAGITTELVVDFNIAHSIGLNDQGYFLKPVTRLINKATTGAISGTVSLNPAAAAGTIVTVSTTDGSANSVSAICKSDGSFLLGFLPPGIYDLTVEAIGYKKDTTLTGITVTSGEVTSVSPVTLTK